MAQAIPFGIVTNLITKLGADAFSEISLVYGVEDELGKLKDTLSTIKATLFDAEERKEKSHVMQDWIRKLNNVVYDADDVLDAFATKALQRELNTDGRIKRQVRDFFSSSKELAFRYKLGHSIKEIRERFDEIAANMSKFNFTGRLSVQASVENSDRETISFVLTSNIIGREKDKEEVLKLIMSTRNNEENVRVITIVGMGGLGKTALTQLVYNDEKVVEYFGVRLWVCVSEEFEQKLLVKKILESLTKNKVMNLEFEQLQIRLRENLEGKRFLLVLDDIWNENPQKWELMKSLLMGGAKGSKIVVTTRSETVASVIGTEDPYILKGLTAKESWNLFEKVAFRGHERVPPNLEVIGKEIIEKCKGVPLAIRSLASVMQSKTQEREWLSIRNSDVWLLCQEDGDILPILKLSYDHLPMHLHLRECFAYCSIFPKDYEFQKEVLIQQWMAQGYVQSSNNIECLEDIGDQYFKNLLYRSFFQDAKVNDYNEVISCKMHDLMHDLAIKVAGSDCSFLQTHEDNISDQVRHVSVAYSLSKIPRKLLKAKGLRTYFCPYFLNLNEASTFIPSNFTCLRVLHLDACFYAKVSSSIGKLRHLRYFDLSRNCTTSLPNSICKLVNLQTLKLSHCWNLKRLPEGITKLINLRYLVTDGCLKLEYMPSGMGKLTSLRILNKFVVGGNKWGLRLSELNGLNELKGDISIEGLENVKDGRWEAKEANLIARQYVHSLTLKWGFRKTGGRLLDGNIDEPLLEGLQPHPGLRAFEIHRYLGMMFPSWMMMGNIVISLPNIVSITLEDCCRCEHLPPSLDQLPFLKFLKLNRLSRVEHINDDEDNSNNQVSLGRKSSSTEEGMSVFFPSLEVLVISYLPRLKGWWRAAETSSMMTGGEEEEEEEWSQRPSFPRLTTLEIRDCKQLTSMPIHLSHLEKLGLYIVPEKLVRQLLPLTTSSAATTTEAITEEGSATSSSSISSLSKLKSLYLIDVESLPEEEVLWKNLSSSLDKLIIAGIPNLVSLPVWLQQLTTLQHLQIDDCPGLMALPDWLSNLTSLQSLYISDCPLLRKRCREETGNDWSKISHIQYMYIDGKVYKDGIFVKDGMPLSRNQCSKYFEVPICVQTPDAPSSMYIRR